MSLLLKPVPSLHEEHDRQRSARPRNQGKDGVVHQRSVQLREGAYTKPQEYQGKHQGCFSHRAGNVMQGEGEHQAFRMLSSAVTGKAKRLNGLCIRQKERT